MPSYAAPAQADEKHQPTSTQEQPDSQATETVAEPRAGYRFWLAFWSIALTNLAAAFDATTLSVALPVRLPQASAWLLLCLLMNYTDPLPRPGRLDDRSLLGRDVLSASDDGHDVDLGERQRCAWPARRHPNNASYLFRRSRHLRPSSQLGNHAGGRPVQVTDLVSLCRRGKLYALISVVWAVESPIGPVIGGVLSQKGAWRWIFWMNLPIVAAGMAGIAVFLRLAHRQRTMAEALRCFEVPCPILFVASATALLMPITWGGKQYPWSSWQTLVPLLLGILGIAAFGCYEKWSQLRWPDNQLLIPLAILSNYSVLLLLVSSVLHGLVLYGFVYYCSGNHHTKS
ncbi:Fungal trichothecene efflux pump [Beauveria brongniartii RCEF 3172]|uniref:Fungal trichothecene efflux pump n=1 Tax=Beauveria brongniartii RCEF 3172 TaxID=1081107 RepID=A0A166YE11_9HYPO|nr:Fungal trichothecene efflux pump [Beauveria brongniartii RCEF 3172]